MRQIVRMLLVSLLCAAVPGSAQGVDEKVRSELEALHSQWFAAFDAGDGSSMDRMEVENLHLVFQDGTIWKKAGPRAGKQKPTGYKPRKLTDVDVRQFGETAILTGTLSATSPKGVPETDGTTVVFVRRDGSWRIASVQWSSATVGK